MPNSKIASFGTWKSPIHPAWVSKKTSSIQNVITDGQDLFWIESQPNGTNNSAVIKREITGNITKITTNQFNVRSTIHEYGGGCITVNNGTLFFTNLSDQRIYRQSENEKPHPITIDSNIRYGDLTVDPNRRRILCVSEEHRYTGRPINRLSAINMDKISTPITLIEGNDFYASPRLNPSGSRIAWITWNQPNMPWDGTELWIAEVDPNGNLSNSKLIAGGIQEAIGYPVWSPDGILYFISDRNGWGNLYKTNENGKPECVHQVNEDLTEPEWVFGLSTYAFISPSEILAILTKDGIRRLEKIDLDTGSSKAIEVPYTDIHYLRTTKDNVFFLGSSSVTPSSIVQLNLTSMQSNVLKSSSDLSIEKGYISVPEPISVPTTQGAQTHAFYYPPQNRDYEPIPGERPPLLVLAHGGPTSSTSNAFSLRHQFWTSRGFAIADVNYRGSTGFGRDYQKSLNGQWGVFDVDDCIAVANFLINRGDVDHDRIIISGRSAGAFTALCALTFRDFFSAGASYYGISDLENLAKETHKFEIGYVETLIGSTTSSNINFRNRSPIHNAKNFSCPIIFFQGLNDKIVPPNQTQTMTDMLRKLGVTFAYVPFFDEQHGFRNPKNIEHSLEAELFFYGQIFNFSPANLNTRVQIENIK